MTSSPINGIQDTAKVSQTKAIAAPPTLPLSWSFVTARATDTVEADAMCCHRGETSRNSVDSPDATMHARRTLKLANGLISISEPVRGSISSCHPGKVASPAQHKAPRARPPILGKLLAQQDPGLAKPTATRGRQCPL